MQPLSFRFPVSRNYVGDYDNFNNLIYQQGFMQPFRRKSMNWGERLASPCILFSVKQNLPSKLRFWHSQQDLQNARESNQKYWHWVDLSLGSQRACSPIPSAWNTLLVRSESPDLEFEQKYALTGSLDEVHWSSAKKENYRDHNFTVLLQTYEHPSKKIYLINNDSKPTSINQWIKIINRTL